VILGDLAKYSMTWSLARPLSDSWASCMYLYPFTLTFYLCLRSCQMLSFHAVCVMNMTSRYC